ncbi:unnamed protein product [Brassica napus]|uniref:(rape) hypothetical protein n=1 Tax=Brassica napus TaxID=3708 RepID=A0A816Z6T9_BRANA|nr:unnamed protein product [Brassica napus]
MRSEGFFDFYLFFFLPVDVKSSILSEWCPGFSIYLFVVIIAALYHHHRHHSHQQLHLFFFFFSFAVCFSYCCCFYWVIAMIAM